MAALRLSMPLLHTLRGSGLANEAIPWAKAFIGAQELGLRCLHPPWGLNRRGYSRDFGTSRLDVAAHLALRAALPTVRITHELIRQTGKHDYAEALRALRGELDLPRDRSVVVTHEAMLGGWMSVYRARPFLLRELLRPRHVARDLYTVQEGLDPESLTIGVHLRFGDFVRSRAGPQPGFWNETLPDAWYERVVTSLLEGFPGRAEAVLVTDDPGEPVVQRLLGLRGIQLPPPRPRPLLSDLLTLVQADVLVCSVSAFSQLAAFLSESPYVWFAPHLNDHGGWRSIWGHHATEQGPNGLTASNLGAAASSPDLDFGRGFPAGGDALQPELFDLLERRLWLKRRSRNLIYAGVVRDRPIG